MLNLKDLSTKKAKADKASGKGEAPSFYGPNLKVTVTREDTGEVLIDEMARTRGFNASVGKKETEAHGGIGWFVHIPSGDVEVEGIACSGQFRLQLSGYRVPPSEAVNMLSDDALAEWKAEDERIKAEKADAAAERAAANG